MKVYAVQCTRCKDIIYSRAHHDCRYCTCGKSMIDGGFEYSRIGGNPTPVAKIIKATKKELYDDWNLKKDKYGIIKGVTK